MKTKRMSALLAALMLTATVVTACGGSDNANTNAGSDNTPANEAANGEEADAAVIDMNEEPYEVAIQIVDLPGKEVANEKDIEAAINEITLPAINCTVDLQYVWISEIQNTTSLGVASNEKLDILHVATLNKLSALVGQDILYDMNEGNLLQTRGQQIIQTFGDYVKAGEVDGQQLAVPCGEYMAQAPAFFYNKTVTDTLGITVPESCTLDELTAFMEEVHAGNPDIMPAYVGQGSNNLMPWMMNLEGFGNNYSYGGIIDFANSTTVENIYTTDAFKEYCLRMYEWRQKGLLCKDSTDSNTSQDYFNAQQLLINFDIYTPGEAANVASSAAQSGFEVGYCTLDVPAVTNSTVAEYMWGIATNSERPDKAMDFLNFLYSNADVANLIMYGIEGTDYTLENNIATRTGAYFPAFYKGGDPRMMHIPAPNDSTYIEQLEALESEAVKSPLIGYIFYDADYQTESAMINNVLGEYLPSLSNGMYNSEEEVLEAINALNADLVKAGIDGVIAGNQEQLNDWLASK